MVASDNEDVFPSSLEDIQSRLMSLTAREFDVVELIAQGYDNRAVADKLCISRNTSKYHLKNIYVKLNLNRAQVIGMFWIWKFCQSNNVQVIGYLSFQKISPSR